jgi:hypothetical protein
MFGSGFHFGRRRRRPASVGVTILLLGLFFGWEYVRGEMQRREEFTGTIVKIYSERSFPGSKHFDHFWDVRSPDGELHTVRIRSKSSWSSAHSGAYVSKRAGEIDPTFSR